MSKLRLIDWVFAVLLCWSLLQPVWAPYVASWHHASTQEYMSDCGVITNPQPVHLQRGL